MPKKWQLSPLFCSQNGAAADRMLDGRKGIPA